MMDAERDAGSPLSDPPPAGIDPAVAQFYDRAPEEGRLTQGPFRLEEARTRELIERLADPRRRDDLLRVARLLESEPSLLGVSAHLLMVARTPE